MLTATSKHDYASEKNKKNWGGIYVMHKKPSALPMTLCLQEKRLMCIFLIQK